MKRILILAAMFMLSLNASALGPWSPAKKLVEGYGHVSLSEGTNYAFGGTFVWGKQHTRGFFLGAGAGLRYVHSVSETEELGGGTRVRYYGGETVLPVFVRARFGRVRPAQLRPFVTADIGTVVNFDPDGNTRGFFFDPQIGLDITDNVYVTLGVDTHHFLSRSIITVSDVIGTVRDPERKVKEIMSSGITIHIGYSF
jgi:hypothetical protein